MPSVKLITDPRGTGAARAFHDRSRAEDETRRLGTIDFSLRMRNILFPLSTLNISSTLICNSSCSNFSASLPFCINNLRIFFSTWVFNKIRGRFMQLDKAKCNCTLKKEIKIHNLFLHKSIACFCNKQY